jgi:hypothetical protein
MVAVVLILTALAMLAARLAYEVPEAAYSLGALITDSASAPVAPSLMYAGIRG